MSSLSLLRSHAHMLTLVLPIFSILYLSLSLSHTLPPSHPLTLSVPSTISHSDQNANVRKFCTPKQLQDVVQKFVPSSCPTYGSMLQYIDKLPTVAVDYSLEEKEGRKFRRVLRARTVLVCIKSTCCSYPYTLSSFL